MQLGNGFTLNPLCEHKPFATEVPEVRVEGADQDWVRIEDAQYKFIKVSYGVTKFEAEEICRENGGDGVGESNDVVMLIITTWQAAWRRSGTSRPGWL